MDARGQPSTNFSGRPPRGGRGLKSPVTVDNKWLEMSPSSRRAWIENANDHGINFAASRYRPRGGRGLKFAVVVLISRPPRGGRGLMYMRLMVSAAFQASLPPRGGRGWIITIASWARHKCIQRRLRGRGLKMIPPSSNVASPPRVDEIRGSRKHSLNTPPRGGGRNIDDLAKQRRRSRRAYEIMYIAAKFVNSRSEWMK